MWLVKLSGASCVKRGRDFFFLKFSRSAAIHLRRREIRGERCSGNKGA
jgi:hypothetical protein